MRLWELDTASWGYPIFSGYWNILVSFPSLPCFLSLPKQRLTLSMSPLRVPYQLCPSQSISLPFPSLSLRKTEQETLFPSCTHTRTFLSRVSHSEEGGERKVIHHPASRPCVAGNCSWMPLAAPCHTFTHILQGLCSLPSPKPGSPERESPGKAKPSQNKQGWMETETDR
jgi:hypothetical protein